MEYTDKLAKYIKKRRMKSGLSLNRFCIESELELSTMYRYENGEREVNIRTLVKFAGYFNQTLSDFFAEFEKELND